MRSSTGGASDVLILIRTSFELSGEARAELTGIRRSAFAKRMIMLRGAHVEVSIGGANSDLAEAIVGAGEEL